MADLPPALTYRGIPDQLRAGLHETAQAAQDYLRAHLSAETLRAYRTGFEQFHVWCQQHQLAHVPADPDSVRLFISARAQAGKHVSTLTKQLAAIRFAHELQDLPSPTDHPLVKKTMAGIRRIHGSRPRQQKAPLLDQHLLQMLALCPPTLQGKRDRAILALGFAGAFRRGELAALDVSDLTFHTDGHLSCLLRRSKTDQAGQGFIKPILNGERLQPVKHLRTWLKEAGITEGPLFRRIDWADGATEQRLSGQWIWRVVKKYAQQIGLDPATIGAHSLRAGFITSAGEHNVELSRIMEVTGQTDPRTPLKYLRRANLFKGHAGSGFL